MTSTPTRPATTTAWRYRPDAPQGRIAEPPPVELPEEALARLLLALEDARWRQQSPQTAAAFGVRAEDLVARMLGERGFILSVGGRRRITRAGVEQLLRYGWPA
jgi:hypothetical protein